MKNGLIDFIKSKRILGVIFTTMLFVGVFTYHQNISQKLQSLSVIDGGIQTCFTRVNQTYTAKMIGSGGNGYLKPDFLATTEECFGEASNLLEEQFSSLLSFSMKKINALSIDVHWFHEKIENGASVFSASENSDEEISSRYSKIESFKDQVLESNGSYVLRSKQVLDSLKVSMGVMVLLVMFLISWEYLDQKRKRENNYVIEREAEIEILTNTKLEGDRVEDLLSRAFDENSLENCSTLFRQYHSELLTDKMGFVSGKVYNEINPADEVKIIAKNTQTYMESSSRGNSEQIDFEGILIDNLLSSVVEHLSDRIFNKGIILKLNIDENVKINLEEEVIEQIFYQLINHSVLSCEDVVSGKSIEISLRKLGGTAVFQVTDTGTGFSSEFIRQELGIEKSIIVPGIELQIAKDLIAETGAEIGFDNIIDHSGMITGGRVKAIFRLQQAQFKGTKGLVQVSKTTKRELLKELSASA